MVNYFVEEFNRKTNKVGRCGYPALKAHMVSALETII
jgi:hypothetical protein